MIADLRISPSGRYWYSLAPGSMVPGTPPGTWYWYFVLVPGTWYWFLVPGTGTPCLTIACQQFQNKTITLDYDFVDEKFYLVEENLNLQELQNETVTLDQRKTSSSSEVPFSQFGPNWPKM